METLIIVVHILAALFMTVVVLIQGGNSGGIGAAFGGGNSQGFFGASGATSFLGKLTYGFAAVFMLTSVTLSVMQSSDSKTGLGDKAEQAAEASKTEEE